MYICTTAFGELGHKYFFWLGTKADKRLSGSTSFIYIMYLWANWKMYNTVQTHIYNIPLPQNLTILSKT